MAIDDWLLNDWAEYTSEYRPRPILSCILYLFSLPVIMCPWGIHHLESSVFLSDELFDDICWVLLSSLVIFLFFFIFYVLFYFLCF